MSILIKGLNIPEMVDNTGIKMELRKLDGVVTIGIMTGGYSCAEQWNYYPIAEISEPHGRLIDAEVLSSQFHKDTGRLHLVTTHGFVSECIEDAPTVIEAEEREDGTC